MSKLETAFERLNQLNGAEPTDLTQNERYYSHRVLEAKNGVEVHPRRRIIECSFSQLADFPEKDFDHFTRLFAAGYELKLSAQMGVGEFE